jgi:serine/threonine protein kinase
VYDSSVIVNEMMEIGNVRLWKRAGDSFPRSGQGEARKVIRVGESDGELFVLKTIHPGQAHRPERQERFRREIEALRTLDDPHILKIVDYGLDDRGTPYLVTPFCENGTLENTPTGTVIETLYRFRGICEGVAHAHERGIAHRDLKPRNILLDADYNAVVGDFGLCFLLNDEAEDDGRVTETFEVAAPRWFGAPESRDGRVEEVTPAGDVYSLGKLLHWMFSRKVFDRENHRSERNLLGRGLADRREYELVHELLDRMIVEEPHARYATASLALEAVTNLIQVIEAKGRPILIDFDHRCDFCGRGTYKFMNGADDSPANKGIGGSLGLGSPQYTSPAKYSVNFWMIAVCDKCSHVLLFRPDLVPEAGKLWARNR